MNEAFSEFWSGLKQTLGFRSNSSLEALDSAFIHALQAVISVLDSLLSEEDTLDQALSQVLQSDVFQCHSQRMIGILIGLLKNPHSTPSTILVVCHLLLRHGLDHHGFFRTLRNHSAPPIAASSTLISGLTTSNLCGGSFSVMRTLLCISRRLAFVPQNLTESRIDHIYTGHDSSGGTNPDTPVPRPTLPNEKQAERRLGPVLAGLLYELCRVEKLEQDLLDVVDESLVGNLFELVELTRDQEDETFNYNLIKLIIALNEQFMVYSIDQTANSSSPACEKKSASASNNNMGRHRHRRQSSFSDTDTNIVIRTMKARLDESKTFGENLIFILNRSSHTTPEGLCVSLLILKILYLLFTTLGTHEYFYTNDLCVLVDVFIRELSDLPDESESLRHTYLRVLHPLLTSTQLRSHPYKRREIRHVLLSHIKYAHLREVNPTTKRLVERNLRADWCLELEGTSDLTNELSLPSKPTRSMSVETLASQASGSLTSVADVTTSSAARSSPIDADIAKVESKACSGDGGSIEVSMGGARASIPLTAHAQALQQGTVASGVSVVIHSDSACATSAPVSSGSPSQPPSIGHDERLRSPWMEPTNDTNASPMSASPDSRPSSTIPHLLYTHSHDADQPARPTSASSTSSLPRRPAPKPPSTKRASKERIPHLRNGPSLPTLRHQAHNQIGLSTSITALNPLRRTLSTPDSPTQEREAPDQDFCESHEDPSRKLSTTTIRRAPPRPPNSQPAHPTSVVRRRKAPRPPAQERQPLDSSSFPVLVETASTQTRSLRSTKSNINLSRNHNVSLNHHHNRVASFSSNPLTTPRGEDFDPFQDKSESTLV